MKTDPYTLTQFNPKRSNQKFESVANRIAFHNKKAKELRDRKKAVDSHLEKNRKILEELLKEEKMVIKSKEFLLGKGFNFGYITHTVYYNGLTLKCIYHFGFIQHDNLNIKLIKL